MYHVATALCEIAEREHIAPVEPDIHLFEELFLQSVERYGRVKELRTVASYNLKSRNPLKDMEKGLSLMRKGAFSPFEMLRGWKKNEKVARLFARAKAGSHGE